MRYCVYRQWQGSKLQDVLEYFATIKEARDYARGVKISSQYTVEVGEFV